MSAWSCPPRGQVLEAPRRRWQESEDKRLLQRQISKFKQELDTVDNIDVQLKGAKSIRLLLCDDNPPIKEVIDSGSLIPLLKILKSTAEELIQPSHNIHPRLWIKVSEMDPYSEEAKQRKLQSEAARVLAKIAAADNEFTIALCNENTIDAFVHLLNNTDIMETAEICIQGLANIAVASVELRDTVLQTEALDWIIDHLFQLSVSTQWEAVRALGEFSRGKPSPNWQRVKKILTPLKNLLSTTKDYDTIVGIIQVFSLLSKSRRDSQGRPIDANGNLIDPNSVDANKTYNIEAIIDSGVVPYIVHLITYANYLCTEASEERQQHESQTPDKLIAYCIHTLSNIVSGTDQQTQAIIDAGFYEVIEIGLQSRDKKNRSESCRALCHVLPGTDEQLNSFFKKPTLIQKVVDLARHGDIKDRTNAGGCLYNAMKRVSYQQVHLLVGCGFIEAMVGLLELNHVEKVLRMSMETLGKCMSMNNEYVTKMEEAGGLNMLEELQHLENVSNRVRQQAARLAEKWRGNTKQIDIFNGECPCCMDSICAKTVGTVTFKCSHAVHVKCYNRMVASGRSLSCPLCRGSAE